MKKLTLIYFFLLFLLPAPSVFCLSLLTVEVSTNSQLTAAVSAANQRGGHTVILLKDGTYTLSSGLTLTAPGIILQGKNSDRTRVIIEGDAMGAHAGVGCLILISAKNCTLSHLTLQKCRWHLVQIRGEHDADGTTIKNCLLKDSYEQMVKISVNPDNIKISGDNGLVENCLFEYSAGIGPQWYIGGIDAHSAKNWIVRNNIFKYITSPSDRISEFAIHFWNQSADNLVEKNLIINCDRGIGFGLGDRGNSGGIIRNNMIYHAAGYGQYADTGIALETSPGTQVYNNTVFLEHSYPSAIEYRFPATRHILIANNLTNKPIQMRNGASAHLSFNVTCARKSWFKSIQEYNLHLASSNIEKVTNKGEFLTGLIDDFDGNLRKAEMGRIDIGADEFISIKLQ